MPSIAVRVRNTEKGPKHQIRLVFASRRTRFTGVIDAPPGSTTNIVNSDIWIALDPPLEPDTFHDFSFGFQGEVPPLPKAILAAMPRAWKVLSSNSALTEWKESTTRQTYRELDDERKERDDELASYLNSKQPDEKRARALAFFWDLEKATAREYLKADREDELLVKIEAMQGVLRERLLSRRGRGTLRSPDPAVLEELSTLQLDLVRKHFSQTAKCGGPRWIDVEAFDCAFIAFAAGQLWSEGSNLWYSKPDTAFFFFFAEFAFAAIELCKDDAEWKSLLPSLVSGQSVFASVFEPYCNFKDLHLQAPSGSLQFGSYHAHPPWLERVSEALANRRRFDPTQQTPIAVLETLHLLNAYEAFPSGGGSATVCQILKHPDDHSSLPPP